MYKTRYYRCEPVKDILRRLKEKGFEDSLDPQNRHRILEFDPSDDPVSDRCDRC